MNDSVWTIAWAHYFACCLTSAWFWSLFGYLVFLVLLIMTALYYTDWLGPDFHGTTLVVDSVSQSIYVRYIPRRHYDERPLFVSILLLTMIHAIMFCFSSFLSMKSWNVCGITVLIARAPWFPRSLVCTQTSSACYRLALDVKIALVLLAWQQPILLIESIGFYGMSAFESE